MPLPRPVRDGGSCRGLLAAAMALGPLAAGARRSAQPPAGEVVVKAPQAILMDADSGAIMFQRNADELMYPASMSKLMLLAVCSRR